MQVKTPFQSIRQHLLILTHQVQQGLQAWIRREIIDFDPYDWEALTEARLLEAQTLYSTTVFWTGGEGGLCPPSPPVQNTKPIKITGVSYRTTCPD